MAWLLMYILQQCVIGETLNERRERGNGIYEKPVRSETNLMKIVELRFYL